MPRYQIHLTAQQRLALVRYFFLRDHVLNWCQRASMTVSVYIDWTRNDASGAIVEFTQRDDAKHFYSRWCR